jgi:hypothetical protein
MVSGRVRRLAEASVAAAVAAGLYRLVVTGALTLDTGCGRTTRKLGPLQVDIDAPREAVFDIIAAPYLHRTTRALAAKLEVLERGNDMVLATHFTPVWPGLTATTMETVLFSAPDQVTFRLVRGPVPQVRETMVLHESGAGTRLDYQGELGTDWWALGRWWGNQVAAKWEATVLASLASIQAEAERHGRGRAARQA